MTQQPVRSARTNAQPATTGRVTELSAVAARQASAQPGWRPGRLLYATQSHDTSESTIQRLRTEGHAVVVARSAEEALELFVDGEYELVLFETELPGLSGFEACRLLRARSDVAIVLVATTGSLPERLLGFDLGADDFVTEQTDFAELDRRIRAALWRSRGPLFGEDAALLGPHGVVVRLRSHEAFVGDQSLRLTPKEFELLRLLLEHRGDVLSSDEISAAVWGYETFGSRNFVEAHISRLRRKLAEAGAPKVVETVRGVGYVVRPGAGD